MAAPPKRYREPLSPRPILDRAALAKSLKSSGVILKDGQLDLFYQLLHRAGYPPLDEFVAELRGEAPSSVGYDSVKDDGSVSVSGSVASNNFRTKNAVSSRPSRRPQLPKSFLSYLSANIDQYSTLTSKVQCHRTSADGTTTKLAVELQDGHVVESVLMRHEGRVTICVSSQVGCAMKCTFCATGTMGMRGNLSEGEILEQLVHGSRILADESSEKENDRPERVELSIENSSAGSGKSKRQRGKQKRMDLIRNVVFMGMGEPLNNYPNVLSVCRTLIDRRLWNLAHNRVTVSTVGVASRMRDLTRDLPEVNLALSLHAPNQGAREKIVPAARGTPIESLIEALDGHMMALEARRRRLAGGDSGDDGKEFDAEERRTASKKKRAMIEYVMLEGDTSTIEAAHQLGKLCEGRHLVVNLIPYNRTDVKDKLTCPSENHMQEFRRIVASYGSFCSIRRTMGADIAGACGQLVVEKEQNELTKLVDIEDGPFGKKDSSRKERPIGISNRGRDRSEENRGGDDEQRDKSADPWVRGLTIATALAASCFAVSATMLLLQRRKR